MKCNKCDKNSVITLQNGNLCKKHFIEYFEKKVRKTIRKYDLITKKDKVCLALSGGKDSLTLFHILKDFCESMNTELFVLFVDEGSASKGITLYEDLRTKYESDTTKFYEVRFKDTFGFDLDKVVEKGKSIGKQPCSICGTLRRYVLNYFSRKMKATVIVTGHTLDDHAQAFMMNLIKGNLEKNFSLGPVAGVLRDEKFTKRAKPLYFMHEDEIRKYCEVKEIDVIKKPCDYSEDSQRGRIKKVLNTLEGEFPATKNSIVKSFVGFMDKYKELLVKQAEEKYGIDKKEEEKSEQATNIAECKKCGEPTSEEVCNTCKLVHQLGYEIDLNGMNKIIRKG